MDASAIHEAAYADCDTDMAKALSRASRASAHPVSLISDPNLTYGEVPLSSMAAILQIVSRILLNTFIGNESGVERMPISPTAGLTLVDLGSGVGKPALAAALLGDFDAVLGIEVLSDLVLTSLRASEDMLDLLGSDIASDLNGADRGDRSALQHVKVEPSAALHSFSDGVAFALEEAGIGADAVPAQGIVPVFYSPAIMFYHGTFVPHPAPPPQLLVTPILAWRDADVIFANSTCESVPCVVLYLSTPRSHGPLHFQVSRRT